MNIEEITNEYLTFAWSAFQFDMHAFSHWWMYAFMLIPACGYAVFFVAKWWFITLPIWMPITLVLGTITRIIKPYPVETDKIKHEKDKEV